MEKSKYFTPRSLIIIILLVLGLGSCANKDSTKNSKTIRLNLHNLQAQIGIMPAGTMARENSPASSSAGKAVSDIKSIVIGPLTFHTHGKAYNSNDPFDVQVQNDLEVDILKTASYMKIINFPVTQEFVEISVPVNIDNFQIVAVATQKKLENLDDFVKTENKNFIAYFGVSAPKSIANSGNIVLTLKRTCTLENPPLGCATYNYAKEPLVTAGVEILGVRLNDSTSDLLSKIKFPIIVRKGGGVDDAKTYLRDLLREIKNKKTITALTVRTTHMLNPAESDDCKKLSLTTSTTTTSTTELESKCSIQTYRIAY